MNIVDHLLPGKTIRDFGALRSISFKIGGESLRVLLIDRYGEFRFVIRKQTWALISFSVSEIDLSLNETHRLRTIIDECNQIADTINTPKSPRSNLRRRVIRDFERLGRTSSWLQRETKRVRLIELAGKLWLELQCSTLGFLTASWNSKRFTLEEALKLQEFIIINDNLTQELSPTPYNPRLRILRSMALITMIGGLFLLNSPDLLVASFIGLSMMMFYIPRWLFFWRFRETRRYLAVIGAAAVLFTLSAIGMKFIF